MQKCIFGLRFYGAKERCTGAASILKKVPLTCESPHTASSAMRAMNPERVCCQPFFFKSLMISRLLIVCMVTHHADLANPEPPRDDETGVGAGVHRSPRSSSRTEWPEPGFSSGKRSLCLARKSGISTGSVDSSGMGASRAKRQCPIPRFCENGQTKFVRQSAPGAGFRLRKMAFVFTGAGPVTGDSIDESRDGGT